MVTVETASATNAADTAARTRSPAADWITIDRWTLVIMLAMVVVVVAVVGIKLTILGRLAVLLV